MSHRLIKHIAGFRARHDRVPLRASLAESPRAEVKDHRPAEQPASVPGFKTPAGIGSPLYLLVALSASILFVELAERWVLSLVPPLPALAEALLDSLFMLLVVFPAVFFFLFRPLVRHMEERRRLNEDLSKAHQLLERAVADRTRQLATLYDVTAMSSTSTDLDIILERCLDRILALTESQVGIIQLLEGGDGLLHLAATRGAPAEMVSRLDSVPRGHGLAGLVMDRGQPVVVSDIAADPRATEGLRSLGRRAYVGVPIEARGQVMGVLSVVRNHGRAFNTEEEALFAAIGHQLGVAVENARLIAEVQGKATLEERQRLARELHDSVTQTLYSLTLVAEAGRRLAEAGKLEQAKDHLNRLAKTSEQALKETRLLVYELRPSALEQEGLISALQKRLDAVERRAGVEVHLQVDGAIELPPTTEEGLYRIAQEALNNALKHSAASEVNVRVQAGQGWVELEVADNGKGFEPNRVENQGGLGLVSLGQRAKRMGGTLSIASAPGAGTAVKVRIPIDQVRTEGQTGTPIQLDRRERGDRRNS